MPFVSPSPLAGEGGGLRSAIARLSELGEGFAHFR
jgi:hypothetical protein